MRKFIIFIVLLCMLTINVSGCFGTFALTRKVYEFNRDLNDKFVQSIVMWAMLIIPVYGVATFIDVVILNLIEFWSGSNPLAMGDTDIEYQYITHEDKTYEVVTTKNRYDIHEVDNPENSFSLVFENSDSSWYLHSQGQIIRVTEETDRGLKLYDLEGAILATF